MGWSLGWDSEHRRDIGYGVPAYCDHPDCSEKIDRGLAHVCGRASYGGDEGCGLFFCATHLRAFGLCERCYEWLDDDLEMKDDGPPPFDPKPDHPEWIHHKLTDESWAQWRAEKPAEVAAMSETPKREYATIASQLRAAVAVQESRAIDLHAAKLAHEEAKGRTDSLLDELRGLDDSF